MSEKRYERIKYIEADKLILDCPIDMEKGALLLDIKNGNVLLQLKLVNISESRISSIHIYVDSFDNAKDPIPGIERINHAFLDLKLDKGTSTGNQNPVILNKLVRNVEVFINKVVFESGEIWRNDGKEVYKKSEQEYLNKLGEEKATHINLLLIEKGIQNSKQLYLPLDLGEVWVCSCGRPNNKQIKKCVRCNVAKDLIFEICNQDFLDESFKKHKAELKRMLEKDQLIKKEQEEKDLKILAKKKIRTKRIAVMMFIIFVISITTYFAYINSNKYRYDQAKDMMEDQRYAQAMVLFDSLENYKDSQVLTAVSQAGIKYEEAINIFKTNNDYHAYRIIDEMDHEFITDKAISKTVLQVGVELFEHKSFTKAKKYFDAVNTSLNVDEFMNSKYFQIEGSWKDIETNDIIEIKLLEENKLSLDESWARWQLNEDYEFPLGSTSEKFIVREAGRDELKLSIIYGYRKGKTFTYTRIK